MNDELPRRQAEDVDPDQLPDRFLDQLPDYGFGGGPLFRDEVTSPGSSGFHDASLVRDGGASGVRDHPGAAYPLGDSVDGYPTLVGQGDSLSGSGSFPTQRSGDPGEYGSGFDYGTGIWTGGFDGPLLDEPVFEEPRFEESEAFGVPRRYSGQQWVDGRHAARIGPRGGPFGGGPGGPAGPGGPGAPGAPGGQPRWGPNEGPLRVVPPEQASALLRIKLPDTPPVPATTLRSDAPIESVVEAAHMLHHVSPARPDALPGDVLALTMATMVVPMPGAGFGGGAAHQRSARLTASVPPDLASRAEADLLSDTVEQFFGDFDAIGRELEAQRAGGAVAGAVDTAAGAGAFAGAGAGVGVGSGAAGGGSRFETSQGSAVPGQYTPAAPTPGRYGVPTQFPGYDAARRGPVGMRYLGGIFHDSSGESSFYDPATESLVPMGAAAFSAAEFRRLATPGSALPPRQSRATAPAPPLRTVPRLAGLRDDDTAVLPAEHWEDHHPDHHRTQGPGRRRARVMLVSAVAAGLAFGGVYAAALALEGQVPKGTVVDGVNIGGLSRAAAEAKLSAALSPKLSAPLLLTADGATLQLHPDQAGLHIDYAGTVAAAASGRDDPLVALPAMVGKGRQVALRMSVDRDALHAALVKTTAGFDKPMVDGAVTFPGGVPTPIAPRPGRQVDVDAAVNAVVAAFDDGVASVRLAAMGRGAGTGIAGAVGGGSVSGVAGSAARASSVGSLAIAPVGYAMPDKNGVAPSQRAMGPKQSPVTPSPTPSAPPSGTVLPDGSVASPSGGQVIPIAPAAPSPATPTPATPTPAAPTGPSFPARPVALVVHDVQPTVTPAAVAQAMQDLARPAMSASVTLVTGSVRTTFKPAVLGRFLAIVPDGRGGLVPKLDGVGVRGEIDHAALARLEQPPTDASFTVTGGKPVLVPGKDGVGFAPQAIENTVIPVLTKSASAQRVATVPIGPLPPALTTEGAEALGVRDVMGTYTAPFTATSQRSANIKRAAGLLHGQIVQPGQTFSLNQVLGANPVSVGSAGSAVSGGSAGTQDTGIGNSLVATALFNAEYLAGLKDVEHHPHAVVTDHFPPGMEAALAYPDVDLKFQNDSGAAVYLWAGATDNAVSVAVLGQKAYDSVQTEMSQHYAQVMPKVTGSLAGGCVASDGVPGFQVDVTRILTKAGQEPLRQVFHTSYAAQDKVVCGAGTPTGSATTGGTSASSPGQPTGSPTDGGPGGGTGGGSSGFTTPPGGTGTPSGGASAGSPAPTTPSAGWDGSLLGGLLGAPSSKH